ncbi:hypothetical protein QH494_26625 [Sphingomonas sp. AR_OL41]|uniref:hypothetical protein n=1 Tax=Sphingomonas sp. AR_OL41 TaxID=3042729 RepID=UPI00247FD156|nr:hypothetical protein [Sphingomonas sp. AR_OL41]MDH7975775.1 hypothetical protein [Sphingomonas sp. AR_OL41]
MLTLAAINSAAYSLALQGDSCISQLTDCSTNPIALKNAESRLLSGRTSDADLEIAHSVARAAPMGSDALLSAGLFAASKNDGVRARVLVGEALRRDPRSATARLYFMDHAMRDHRYSEVVSQGDRLTYIRPSLTPLITQIFAQIVTDPAARPALAAGLTNKPLWQGSFFAQLRLRGVDPRLTFQLLNDSSRRDDVTLSEQDQLAYNLFTKGDYDRAYLAWLNFLPSDAIKKVSPVYDSGFDGLPGGRPFNWQLLGGAGAAVTIEDGSLSVDYFGRAPMRLAQESLLLPAGRYRLATTANATRENVDGILTWQVICLPANKVIIDLDLNKLPVRSATFATAFVVPDGCAAQILALSGSPSTDFSNGFKANFEAVHIDHVP